MVTVAALGASAGIEAGREAALESVFGSSPTTASSVSSSFKASAVSASSGEPVAVGRVDASEPRAGLREPRRAEGGTGLRSEGHCRGITGQWL
jgi:hypothetical protein